MRHHFDSNKVAELFVFLFPGHSMVTFLVNIDKLIQAGGEMVLLGYLFFWKQSSEPLSLLLSFIFIFAFKLLDISLTSVNF